MEKTDPKYREVSCPYCDFRDIVSIGTYRAAGKAEVEVVYNDVGDATDAEPVDSTIVEDYQGSVDADYDHNDFRCERCDKEFPTPKYVPLSDEDLAELKTELLEAQGQQRLVK